jgi:hypothetical protein
MNRIQIRRTTRRPDTPDVVAMPANGWRSILELGRLAPTPHNTQWYLVRVVDSRTAHVCTNESIAIPFTDPNDQFRYTGLGAFTRHLEAAARAAGFELHTTFDDVDPALADNLVRAGHAACSYPWRMPPRRSRLTISR